MTHWNFPFGVNREDLISRRQKIVAALILLTSAGLHEISSLYSPNSEALLCCVHIIMDIVHTRTHTLTSRGRTESRGTETHCCLFFMFVASNCSCRLSIAEMGRTNAIETNYNYLGWRLEVEVERTYNIYWLEMLKFTVDYYWNFYWNRMHAMQSIFGYGMECAGDSLSLLIGFDIHSSRSRCCLQCAAQRFMLNDEIECEHEHFPSPRPHEMGACDALEHA